MLKAYKEIKSMLREKGKTPIELESVYHSDMKSFFEYFDFFNVSKVTQRAGINRKYTSGVANAGESQTFCRALMRHVFLRQQILTHTCTRCSTCQELPWYVCMSLYKQEPLTMMDSGSLF